jgi:hypothetical protein
MNQKLSDALDLLRMLEVVFEQQQLVESTEGASVGSSGKGKPGAFPWAGVRLTLKQSRELLLSLQSPTEPHSSSRREGGPQVDTGPLEKAYQVQNPPRRGPSHQENYQKNRQAPPPPREKTEATQESPDRPYRGTFNRIQLTQEPAPAEEQLGS